MTVTPSAAAPRSLHFCTSESWGGLELYAGTLISELNIRGYGVAAVCAPGSPLWRFLESRGVVLIALPSGSKLSPRSVRQVVAAVRLQNFNALHVHFHRDIWTASFAARLVGPIRLVMSIYMGVGRKKDPAHRFIYSRVDSILTSSKALNAVLPERYPVNAEKIHYLAYGRYLGQYAVSQSTRAEARERYGIPSGAFVAGTMVRLDEGKGVMDFIKSFPLLDADVSRNLYYLVVGEPTRKSSAREDESPFEPRSREYLDAMKDFVAKNALSDRIKFVGFQPDTVACLSAMDMFVFPSRDEMYSLAVLDAMAMSLPVVAAGSGGNLLQIAEGVTGMLYRTADSADLARVLSGLVHDAARREALGAAARKFVEREHSMPAVVDRLLTFYGKS